MFRGKSDGEGRSLGKMKTTGITKVGINFDILIAFHDLMIIVFVRENIQLIFNFKERPGYKLLVDETIET